MVTSEMAPPRLRAEPIRVQATPDMVRLVEQRAIQAVQPGVLYTHLGVPIC